jgi:hypothetical protein
MAESDKPSSELGRFIQTYSSFLSTFVIGAAGLVATSIWQYRQSEIAAKQAESSQRIAVTQADNQWRIERAEILSKNLGVLSASGEDTVEQRYGVLLSLTRGNILDAELAVSYALELGKDNPAYMRSVLASTPEKSFLRLANAFELTCDQRFDTTRERKICLDEKRVSRSEALIELFADEQDNARRHGEKGPAELLADERLVQSMPLKLSVLFSHYLYDLFERRQLAEIKQFANLSVGAHLVSSLVLSADQPNTYVAASEAKDVEAFHLEQASFVKSYLFGQTCNGDCKGKLIDIMFTSYAEAHGRYDQALRELFSHPRGEVAMGLARLHTRLLSCQFDPEDALALRDGVLEPALLEATKAGNEGESALFDDLLSLLALTPDPDLTPEQAPMRKKWEQALTAAREYAPERYDTAFTKRRVAAQKTRKAEPGGTKDSMFCSAKELTLADEAL